MGTAGMVFEGGGGWAGERRRVRQTFSRARTKDANPDPHRESPRVVREGRGHPETQLAVREKWALRVPRLPIPDTGGRRVPDEYS